MKVIIIFALIFACKPTQEGAMDSTYMAKKLRSESSIEESPSKSQISRLNLVEFYDFDGFDSPFASEASEVMYELPSRFNPLEDPELASRLIIEYQWENFQKNSENPDALMGYGIAARIAQAAMMKNKRGLHGMSKSERRSMMEKDPGLLDDMMILGLARLGDVANGLILSRRTRLKSLSELQSGVISQVKLNRHLKKVFDPGDFLKLSKNELDHVNSLRKSEGLSELDAGNILSLRKGDPTFETINKMRVDKGLLPLKEAELTSALAVKPPQATSLDIQHAQKRIRLEALGVFRS